MGVQAVAPTFEDFYSLLYDADMQSLYEGYREQVIYVNSRADLEDLKRAIEPRPDDLRSYAPLIALTGIPVRVDPTKAPPGQVVIVDETEAARFLSDIPEPRMSAWLSFLYRNLGLT